MPVNDPGARVPDPVPDGQNVAAVIVTYHPEPGLPTRLAPLVGQVGSIVVVDNGSIKEELAPLYELEAQGMVAVIRNATNAGLATALNQGLRWVSERGFTWALTLDQDTEPESSLVEEAARVFGAFRDRHPAVIGAGRPETACPEDPGRPVAYVITAGALHSVRDWEALGGFRDDFFIDRIDVEFCLRARARGRAVVTSCRPTIRHAIGRPTRHRALMRWVSPSNHDPVRRYYITRNRVVIWITYWRQEPRFIAFDMWSALKEVVKLLIFEDQRRDKLGGIGRGVWDALRGRTGQLVTPRGNGG